MNDQIKAMLEEKIASIETELEPMYDELTKIAGVVSKNTDFWLLNGQVKKLVGKLEGINMVLEALGYTRMIDASGNHVIVDTKTLHHAIGLDQFEGGAEG